MFRPAFFITSALIVAGCTSQSALSLPEVTGARSMLLVYSDSSGDTRGIFAVDLEQPVIPPFALAESDLFFILAYGETLAELGLAPGKIEIVTDQPYRPLPDGYTAFQGTGAERNAVEIEAQTFIDLMGAIRLRSFASGECEAQGGCFRVVDSEEYCWLPCTLPDVAPPVPPDPPEAPNFGECPSGWSQDSGACRPPDVVGCGGGEAQLLGDATCTNVAGPCAARFPSGLSGTIAYVDASVPGPGSGSDTDPFRTLSSALAAGTDAIAMAAGTYSESLSIARTVEIAGACRQTLLSGQLTISGDVTLRNLRLAGSNLPLSVTGVLTSRNVEIHGIDQAVRVLSGGTFTGDTLLIADGSAGISVESGTLTLLRARILGGTGPGVLGTGATMTLNDVFISDRISGRGLIGAGVRAAAGSHLSGERWSITETGAEAVSLPGAGTTAEIDYLVVRDPPGAWLPKHGITVGLGASATIDRAFITDTGYIGIASDGGIVTVNDSVFVDTGRAAIRARLGGELSATRVLIRGAHVHGINSDGADATLTDVRIEDVHRARIAIDMERLEAPAYGVLMSNPDRAAMTRLSVARVDGSGLYVSSGSSVDLSHLRISDLTGTSRAVSIINTPGNISSAVIENVPARALEIYAFEQKQLTFNDVRIANAGAGGLGISLVTLTGARFEIDGAKAGAIIFDRAVLNVSDARVANVEGGASMQVGTADNMDYRESFFQLQTGRFENNSDSACMVLGWYGVIDASDAVVTGCDTGFEILIVEIGKERIPRGMLFLDNGVNVKTATGE